MSSCIVCGRPLTNPASIARNMGAICASKGNYNSGLILKRKLSESQNDSLSSEFQYLIKIAIKKNDEKLKGYQTVKDCSKKFEIIKRFYNFYTSKNKKSLCNELEEIALDMAGDCLDEKSAELAAKITEIAKLSDLKNSIPGEFDKKIFWEVFDVGLEYLISRFLKKSLIDKNMKSDEEIIIRNISVIFLISTCNYFIVKDLYDEYSSLNPKEKKIFLNRIHYLPKLTLKSGRILSVKI